MRVLFLAAHPDDIEGLIGGTAVQHYRDGDEMFEAIMTRGEKGAVRKSRHGEKLAATRTIEAKRAGEAVGMKEVELFGIPDGAVKHHEGRVAEVVAEVLERYKPDLVYLPEYIYSFYQHPDHLTLGRVATEVIRKKSPKLPLRYFHTLRPTHIYSVKETKKQRNRAFRMHKSQFWVLVFVYIMIFTLFLPMYIRYAIKAGSTAFEFYREDAPETG